MKDENLKSEQPIARAMTVGRDGGSIATSSATRFFPTVSSLSSQKPVVGEIPDPTDSTYYLQGTAVPEKKKRGFLQENSAKNKAMFLCLI